MGGLANYFCRACGADTIHTSDHEGEGSICTGCGNFRAHSKDRHRSDRIREILRTWWPTTNETYETVRVMSEGGPQIIFTETQHLSPAWSGDLLSLGLRTRY